MDKEVQISGEDDSTPDSRKASSLPSDIVTAEVPDIGSSLKPAIGLEVLRAQLKEISALYARELPARMEALELAFAEVHREKFSPASLDILYRQVHKLSGSAATFGFPALTDASRRLEALLRPILRGEGVEAVRLEEELYRALQALQVAAREPQM